MNFLDDDLPRPLILVMRASMVVGLAAIAFGTAWLVIHDFSDADDIGRGAILLGVALVMFRMGIFCVVSWSGNYQRKAKPRRIAKSRNEVSKDGLNVQAFDAYLDAQEKPLTEGDIFMAEIEARKNMPAEYRQAAEHTRLNRPLTRKDLKIWREVLKENNYEITAYQHFLDTLEQPTQKDILRWVTQQEQSKE